ncbi:MAG: SGNH/GDSL hydrolase family protein [Candidatus Rokubacteria bacterium]|nr:SGNH/GDSL hydrolase family protein [Candidatus Rokubacteria bacterium]
MGSERRPAWLLIFSLAVAVVFPLPSTAQGIHARRLPTDGAKPLTYVALGDSTVSGVGATDPERNYVSRLYERLRSAYPAARVVNLGVSGATAANVVDGQLERAVALRPDLVTLSIGPNDVTRGRAAAEYEQDLETIFGMLLKETPAVLVVNLIPDLTLTPRFRGREGAAEVGRRVARFNRALRGKARAHGVEIVDLFAQSRREVPRRPELIAADGYHPSDQGYARWAELMWRGVERRLDR